MTSVAHGATRVVAIGVVWVCAAVGLAAPDDVIAAGVAWLIAIAASLAGWGALVEGAVRRAAPDLDDDEFDLGLRLAWGTAAFLLVAGVVLALGLLTQAVILGLVGVGLLLWSQRQLRGEAPTGRLARALAWCRRDPQGASLLGVAAALALFAVLVALVRADVNVFDDDIIYTPMVQRLLDVGDLHEPFSFRRLSALGGQTVLAALAGARGTLASPFAIDAGLFQIMVLLLLAGVARGRAATAHAPAVAGADRAVVALVVLAVLLLPRGAINTASYWTGVALFLALYRTLVLASRAGMRPAAPFAVAAIVAAACATLRQSYLPIATLTVAGAAALRVAAATAGPAAIGARLRAAWRAERRTVMFAAAAGVVALAPWCVATWRSSGTFLFPLQLGTFNPNLALVPATDSAWQELQLLVRVALEPEPIRSFVLFVPVLLIAADRRPGRPLTLLTIASAVGVLLLVHQFALSDPPNLWRYAFGYTLALVLLVALETARGPLGEAERSPGPVALPTVGRVVVIVALLVQLATSGPLLRRRLASVGDDLDAAAAGQLAPSPATVRAYAALQAAAPADAPLAVMLDEPVHLDYQRNRIVNLDTPGFASWRPGLPMFLGPEPVAAYLLDQGLRYVAFVRGDRSRYMYRRDWWIDRLLTDTELWRTQAAYLVDAVDNLAALATTRRVLHEQDGLVLLDLAVRR